SVVGYVDVDLSTPIDDVLHIVDALEARRADVAMGARVALLGRDIERNRARHYLGRVFATAASMILHLRVYDTQCGAKFFRAGPPLTAALAAPFSSRWAFDVELIGRLLLEGVPAEKFVEVPLHRWSDVGGSKLAPVAMLRTG